MPDVQSDTRARNASRLSAEGIVSAAGVPLAVGARILGALAVGTTERHDYSEEELSLLQSLADQAAIAINNARLFFDEQTRRAYLNALLEINTKIGTLAPTTTLLSSIAEEAARLLALDNAGFRLLEGDELVLAGMAGTAVQTMVRPRLRVGESLSGRVVDGRPLLAVRPRREPALVAEHVAADRRLGYTKFLGVPLKVGERTIGVLTFRARRPFSPRDQELAEAFAGQAAVALEHSRLYQDARQQAARMRALADLGRVLSETLDPDVVGQRVADSICALLGARASALYRTGPGGELLALATSRSGSFDWAPVLAPGIGMAGLAVRERQPVAGPDVLTDTRLHYEPAVRESLATNPDRALLGAPLIVRDRLLGALAVADRTGRVFDTEDTRLAQAFADQAALALENAGLYRETEQRRREAEELARLAGSLTESLETDAMAARIAESVVTLFSVQSSVIRRLRPDGALVALASAGRAREIAEPGHVLPPGTGTSGRAVQRGAAVTTTQIFDDSDVNLTDELREQMARVGDAAQLAVPMRAEGRTIGSLSISDRAGRIFSEAETRLLQAFADQAALALENARLYAETMRRRQEAEELARLAQTLTESLDVSDVVGRTVESVLPLFRARSSVLRLLQPDGSLVALAIGGQSRANFEPGHVTPSGTGVLGRAVAEGRAVAVSDILAANAPVLGDDLRERLRDAGEGAILAVPLRVSGTIIGALGIADRGGRQFSAEEAHLLQAFADQAALALENARLFSLERSRRRQIAVLADIEREFAAELDSARLLASRGRALRRPVRRRRRHLPARRRRHAGARGVDHRGPGRHPRDARRQPGRGGRRRAPRRPRQRLPELAAGAAGVHRSRDPPRDGPAADHRRSGARRRDHEPLGRRRRAVPARRPAVAGELRRPGGHRAGERAPVSRGGDAGRAPAHAEPAQSPGHLVARPQSRPGLDRRGGGRDRPRAVRGLLAGRRGHPHAAHAGPA